ncbi:MAG: circularly permuted type 2 ATP-grasp protein [Myxococcota bacterium]
MKTKSVQSLFADYRPLDDTFDELYDDQGVPRTDARSVVSGIDTMGQATLRARQQLASRALLTGGITFSVYSDQRGSERVFPFDVIPRVVSPKDWSHLEAGLQQRATALDLFLADVYGEQRIVKEGIVPGELIESSAGYLPKMRGIRPNGGVYVHIAGIDLIRDADGTFLVLEDNLRTPSGVSYVLENRAVVKRVLAPVLQRVKVRSVDEYPARLRKALASLAPEEVPDAPRVVVLTPGPFNSAYFEHSFLARRMGCDLVHPSDLFVDAGRVFVKTTAGPQPVDVIYRRVDDEFIDPTVFREDSLLGVPGIVEAYAKGGVTLANALGNGVADDKAIYPYVPAIIRFYLSEDPILKQVDTLLCSRDNDRQRVLENLSRMVVKQVDASGGYGMLMGPKATKAERVAYADKIKANPRDYIAQPLVSLSACPTWTGREVAPRRVDLRPFIVRGKDTWVLPGGLTRVALAEGSYVVNSSQGGGSKDTWVLEGDGA